MREGVTVEVTAADRARLEAIDADRNSRAKKREDEYYTALYQWFENGGAEALLYSLKTRDISTFNPNALALDTASKQHAIEQN